MTELRPMLTPSDAAELLNCSRRTIDRRLADGSIFCIQVGGLVRIPRDRLLTDLGLTSRADGRRRARQAAAEAHAALAATGGTT